MQLFNPDKPELGDFLNPDDMRNNFLSIATCFAGPTSGITATMLQGMLYYNTSLKKLFIFDGSVIVPVITNQDHAILGGLDNDDHTQYALLTGLRSYAGITCTAGFKIEGIDLSDLSEAIGGIDNSFQNPSFDDFDTSLTTVPAGWTDTGSPTLAGITTTATNGTGKALQITSAGVEAGVQQIIDLKQYRSYTLSVYAKVSSGNLFRIRIYAGDTVATPTLIKTFDYAGTNWARFKVEFTLTGTQRFARIQFLATNTVGSCWVDETSLFEGDLIPSSPPFSLSLDKAVRSATYRGLDAVHHDIGNVFMECGLVSLSLSGTSVSTQTITFDQPFKKTLMGEISLQDYPPNPVIPFVNSVTNSSMVVGVRTPSGDVTQTQTVGWIAYGIR